MPTLLPTAGTYPAPVDVRMATTTSGAVVRYTLDGTDPILSSSPYQWPIAVGASDHDQGPDVQGGLHAERGGHRNACARCERRRRYSAPDAGGGWFAAGLTGHGDRAGGRGCAALHHDRRRSRRDRSHRAVRRHCCRSLDGRQSEGVERDGGGECRPTRRLHRYRGGGHGGYASHALKADGTVWSWGRTTSGRWGMARWRIGDPGAGLHTCRRHGDCRLRGPHAGGQSRWNGLELGTQCLRAVGRRHGRVPVATGPGAEPRRIAVAVAAGRRTVSRSATTARCGRGAGTSRGNLAMARRSSRSTPTMIAGLTGVARIAAGDRFSLGGADRRRRGRPRVGVGENTWGQLGDGSTVARAWPVHW